MEGTCAVQRLPPVIGCLYFKGMRGFKISSWNSIAGFCGGTTAVYMVKVVVLICVDRFSVHINTVSVDSWFIPRFLPAENEISIFFANVQAAVPFGSLEIIFMWELYRFRFIIKGIAIISKSCNYNLVFCFHKTPDGKGKFILAWFAAELIIVDCLYKYSVCIGMISADARICFAAIGKGGRGPGISFAGIAYLTVRGNV